MTLHKESFSALLLGLTVASAAFAPLSDAVPGYPINSTVSFSGSLPDEGPQELLTPPLSQRLNEFRGPAELSLLDMHPDAVAAELAKNPHVVHDPDRLARLKASLETYLETMYPQTVMLFGKAAADGLVAEKELEIKTAELPP